MFELIYNEIVFFNRIPEDAPVREKMIYASTKATLKSQFGSGQIKEDLLGTALVILKLKCILFISVIN